MSRVDKPVQRVEATPSRHRGSRVVPTTPDAVRTIVAIRGEVGKQSSRVRREEMTFVPAPPARGEPCTAAVMTDVLVTMAYRSGHALYVDLALGTGASSVMEARIAVPDLGLVGGAVASASGGVERDVRIELSITDVWPMGEAHRVYVQARRVSGADATTVRVLRAWQR